MADIEGVVRFYRHEGGDKRCWDAAGAASTRPLGARATVSLDISRAGKVTSARAKGAETTHPKLAPCLAKWARTWRFPASEGRIQINVPFWFESP